MDGWMAYSIASLNSHERSLIADCLEPISVPDGTYIIRQGERAEKFYLVEKVRVCQIDLRCADGRYSDHNLIDNPPILVAIKGEAIATQMLNTDEKEEEVVVGRMKEGQYFGERALIKNEPRAANVKALGPLKVAAMDRASFERLLGDRTELMKPQIEQYQSAATIRKSVADPPQIEEQ